MKLTSKFGAQDTTFVSAVTVHDGNTIHEISNGICKFSPTSTRGKWIFLLQTVLISFIPIGLLVIQNSLTFNDLIVKKQDIQAKDKLVVELTSLSGLVKDLQLERSAVALAIFMDSKTGKVSDLVKEYSNTDRSLATIVWKQFGEEKIFETKLRFQIRLDDFREKVSMVSSNDSNSFSDSDVLGFYNLATGKLLSGLEEDIGNAQTGSNWRLLLTYFNMLQILENSGIGLVYGLRFYSMGSLSDSDIIHYVRTNALMYEYYKQSREMVPPDIGTGLIQLFNSEAFIIVNTSTAQILANLNTNIDLKKAKDYFEGSMHFMSTLNQVLDQILARVRLSAEKELSSASVSQIWGVVLLLVVMIISPLLVILARNAISSIQMFAQSVEKKSDDMRRQRKKQDALIYKMLPRTVVERLNSGQDTAETFESATLYFSSVVDFTAVTKNCSPMEVVEFLNNLYNVMDQRMDAHDVFKVETISDSYLVASGLPKRNGDKHVTEICNMALDLQAACGMVVRPDIKPRTIAMKAGIHTGGIVAGVVGSKMPRYCLFGDTINTASRMQSSSDPGMIQISSATHMMLECVGGYRTEERGVVEIKGKGQMTTYWLLEKKQGHKKGHD